MSLDFVAYEDAAPTGTLRHIADQARHRRLKFYGRMKRNFYVPPEPDPPPVIEAAPEPARRPIVFIAPPQGFDRVPIIQKFVAAHYSMTRDQLLTRSTKWLFSHPRQIAIFFAREFTTRSLPEIGMAFGGKDHQTIWHAIKKTGEREATDLVFAAEIAEMRAGLKDILT